MSNLSDFFFKSLSDDPEQKDEQARKLLVCVECYEHDVERPGDLCLSCQADHARGYRVQTLAGRCADGAERDHGTRWHAVPLGTYTALCGAKPGRRSAGWSDWRPAGQEVTCPRCARKLGKK